MATSWVCAEDEIYGNRIVFSDSVLSSRDARQELIKLAKAGDVKGVECFLRDPQCDVNATGLFGDTALINAAWRIRDETDGYAQITKQLLKHPHIDVNLGDMEGKTALYLAAYNANPTAVKILMNDKRCDVNKPSDKGKTALIKVAWMVKSDDDVYAEIIKLLMTHKDIDTRHLHDDNTAIDCLLQETPNRLPSFNHFNDLRQTVSLLCSQGYCNTANKHAMAEAIAFQPLEICSILLENGFDPNSSMPQSENAVEIDALFGTRHREGRETALHCAVRLDSVAKVELLLKYKPNLTVKWRGLTPLELAIAYNVNPDILELLSQHMPPQDLAEAMAKGSIVCESVQECAKRVQVDAFKAAVYLPIRKAATKRVEGPASSKLRVPTPILKANKLINIPAAVHKASLKTVTGCRKQFKRKSHETQNIPQNVIQLLETVSDILSELVSGLRFKPILVGSMAEDTKVYLPNEIDVMCVLDEEVFVLSYGFSHSCSLKQTSSLPRWIMRAPFLSASNLAEVFYSGVEFALTWLAESHTQFGKLRLFKRSLVWCDKVSRLQLMWNGKEFKNMMISVDLAVCVRVKKADIGKHMRVRWRYPDLQCKEYFLMCKTSRFNSEHRDKFALSASNLEQEILNRLPINVKRGLILAKAVRIASIAKPDENLSTAFCLAEDVHIDDLISSHMLKSCLIELHLDTLYDFDSGVTPCDVASRIYIDLKQKLEKTEVTSWIGRSMLDCRYCARECSCCMKRKLMLAMTRKILQWLQDNEAQLQDIDYADDVDLAYDVKLRVWPKGHSYKDQQKASDEAVAALVFPMSNLMLRNSSANATTPTVYAQTSQDSPQRQPNRRTAQSVTYLHPHAVVAPKQRNIPKCWYCTDGHTIRDCAYFVALDRSQKLAVIRDRKLCYRCLNKGHIVKHCRSRMKCEVCGRRHLTVMHRYKRNTAT